MRKKNVNFDVVKSNFLLDIKDFLNSNFIASRKGYFPFVAFIIYKIIIKLPMRRFIKNNISIPISFCEKNRSLKVKPVFTKVFNGRRSSFP